MSSEVIQPGVPAELAAGGDGFNWKGLNPAQMKSIAQAMAMSGMFPDISKDSAKAFVKIMAGQEMGIAPFQAMSDISIISGKAAPGGNIFSSKVKGSGRYDYRVKSWDKTGCSIEFFERLPGGKKESLGVSSFDEEDAKAAGLFNNANYKKYAKNMYFNRAITGGVRTFCPDVLGGINAYSPEELGATVDEEGRVVQVDTTPEPAPTPAPKPKASKPAAKKAADAPEAEVVEDMNVLQMIGKELEDKGFDDKLERQTIALKVGHVARVDELNDEEWYEVYETIQTLDTADLRELLPGADPLDEDESDEPLPTPPVGDEDQPEEKSIEQAMADGDTEPPSSFLAQPAEEPKAKVWAVPNSWVLGELKLPRPDMKKLYKEMMTEYSHGDVDVIATICQQGIGKDKPTLADDYITMCYALAERLNQTEQGTLV